MIKLTVLSCLAALMAAPVFAQDDECALYTYRAKVVRVIDGDTLVADVDLGFRIHVNGETFRLYGIDAPETQSRGGRVVTEEEKARGLLAKETLRAMLEGKDIFLCTIKDKQGKYGRYLARIFYEGVDVNRWLVDNGHAVPYGDLSAALN